MAIVLEATNPYGNLAAVVEDDGLVVTLYVHPIDERSIPARSLKLLERVSKSEPMSPATLRIVWSPEGDGVVVLEADRPIGQMPSGPEGGYAVRSDSSAFKASLRAVEESDSFFARFSGNDSQSPFALLRDAELARLEAKFGTHSAYFAADDNRFPPLSVVEFTPEFLEGGRIYVSLGMRLRPLPATDARAERHVEIAMATSGEAQWGPNVVAWLARYPWRVYSSVADGVLVASPAAEASWFVPDRSAVFLLRSPPDATVGGKAVRAPVLDIGEGPQAATFLWGMPASMQDLRTARLAGSARVREVLVGRGE
jgi:hypothetical protein